MRVRESSRRRGGMRIGVGPNRPLEVIVPTGTSDRSIRKVLEQNRDWIDRRLRSVRAVAEQPSVLGLDRPGVVHLNGQTVPVVRRAGRASARLTAGRLVVGGSAAAAAAAVERWYRREAGERIAASVRLWEPVIGVSATTISIRDPSSRWGSCSSRGTLSFSWRLLLAPADILEYVVVHELCHLLQPNHSRAFWALVEQFHPVGGRRRRGCTATATSCTPTGHKLRLQKPQRAAIDVNTLSYGRNLTQKYRKMGRAGAFPGRKTPYQWQPRTRTFACPAGSVSSPGVPPPSPWLTFRRACGWFARSTGQCSTSPAGSSCGRWSCTRSCCFSQADRLTTAELADHLAASNSQAKQLALRLTPPRDRSAQRGERPHQADAAGRGAGRDGQPPRRAGRARAHARDRRRHARRSAAPCSPS